MKVKDLISVLKTFDPDERVAITLEGAEQSFEVDKVSEYQYGVLLESEEVPDFNDMVGMANSSIEANRDIMDSWKTDALFDLIIDAENRGAV